MNSLTSTHSSYMGRYYMLALFIYSAAVLLYITHNYHGICPDEAAYYNIALKYRDGHFKEALNAYWSPLLSWLMVPLSCIPAFAFYEIMIVNFFSGILIIYVARRFSRRHQLTPVAELFFLFTVVILSIFIQMPLFGADFLSTVAFVTYIFLVSSIRNEQHSYFYLLSAAGALFCAFGKSIFIFYVLAHLLVLILFSLLQKNKNRIYTFNLLKILFIFTAVIAIWTALLSWKYGRFIINSSAAYNFTLFSPQGYLPHYGAVSGLLEPPDQYSVIHWVDPTYYPIQKRAIFESKESLLFEWGILKYNLRLAYYAFSYFSYLKLGLLLFLFTPLLLKQQEERKQLFIYLLSPLAILAAYTLIFVEERYLIGCQFMIFIAVFFSFHCLIKEKFSSAKRIKWIYLASLLLICISFLKNSTLQFATWQSYHKEFEPMMKVEEEIVKLPFLKNKKLANGPFRYSGHSLDYISFRTGSMGYGNTKTLDSDSAQYLDLKKHSIDYYFHQQDLSEEKKLPSFLKDKTPAYISADSCVMIFSMKPYQ